MARVIITSSTARRWLASLTKKRTVLIATLVTSLAFIVLTLKWARSPGPPPGVRSVPRWQRSSLWVEDGRDHVNPHRFAYINNHPDVCGEEEEVDLLIMVSTAVDHVERRQAIRSTWGSPLRSLDNFKAKMVFLLGNLAKRDDAKQSEVDSESHTFGDVIQEDFIVSYCHLTMLSTEKFELASEKKILVYCTVLTSIQRTDNNDVKKNSTIPNMRQNESYS